MRPTERGFRIVERCPIREIEITCCQWNIESGGDRLGGLVTMIAKWAERREIREYTDGKHCKVL